MLATQQSAKMNSNLSVHRDGSDGCITGMRFLKNVVGRGLYIASVAIWLWLWSRLCLKFRVSYI